MKPSVTTTTVKHNPNKPMYSSQSAGLQGQPPISTYMTAGTVSIAMPSKSVTSAGVSANPHHFPLANQNGLSSNVTSNQSQAPPTTTGLTNEKGRDKALSSSIPQPNVLANTKEKTPMCLINELARYNRVSHQYTLVDEQGPAHKKTFFVKLQIGDKEEYSASGPSIKKAQHSAAGIALEKTEFKHPPPKPMKTGEMYMETVEEMSSITPTVELNSLAMKRGEPAIYKNIENRNPQHIYFPHNYDFRGMYNQRYHYMRPPRAFYVSLKVGTREFIGEGISRQMARHNAAKKALEILRNLKIPEPGCEQSGMKVESNLNNNAQTEEDVVHDDDTKSEISLVHEVALRHNLPVSFDVIRESGPPHMKNFVTQCLVGNFKTEAEGSSKKLSKKRAAEMMLQELRNLPSLPPSTPRPKTKPVQNKKKNKNLIKMQKADPTYGVGINPISRLIQIQQAQKKKEPVYSLLAERGLPRRREFVMQVQVDEHTCSGVGPNKKLAKRHAAEAMLQLMGYNKPSPQPTKPAIKTQGDTSMSEKKVTFLDATEDHGQPAVLNGSRQLVPGLIVLPEGKRNTYTQLKGLQSQYTAAGMMKASGIGTGRPELKLRELCERININIKFDEFAGANNPSEFLSRLTISSNPPHTLHGSGQTPEAAKDSASLTALKILAEMGLVKEDSPVNMAAGDGFGGGAAYIRTMTAAGKRLTQR